MAEVFPVRPDRITDITEEFSTNITVYENRQEQRSPNYEESKPTFKLSFKMASTATRQAIVDHFKDRQGSYKPFVFHNHIDGQDYSVRFKSDKLPWSFTNVSFADVDIEVVVC